MPTFPSGKRVENIQCTEQAFPEFPDLLFGTSIDKSIQYFDASDYLKKQGILELSVNDFLKNYFYPISSLVNAYELDRNRVCILNVEGHTLLDSNLVYLFISYINPDFLAHLNDRIHELFKEGICVSDTYLYRMAKYRLSPEIFNSGDDGDPKKSDTARRILVFDSFKKLSFIAQSQVKLARMLGVTTPTIKGVCDGPAISTCGYYLRWWDSAIEIDVQKELGVLTLKEYDDLLGVQRKVYRDRKMTRKSLRLKYNMKATPEKLKRLQKNGTNQNQDCQQI